MDECVYVCLVERVSVSFALVTIVITTIIVTTTTTHPNTTLPLKTFQRDQIHTTD